MADTNYGVQYLAAVPTRASRQIACLGSRVLRDGPARLPSSEILDTIIDAYPWLAEPWFVL